MIHLRKCIITHKKGSVLLQKDLTEEQNPFLSLSTTEQVVIVYGKCTCLLLCYVNPSRLVHC